MDSTGNRVMVNGGYRPMIAPRGHDLGGRDTGATAARRLLPMRERRMGRGTGARGPEQLT